MFYYVRNCPNGCDNNYLIIDEGVFKSGNKAYCVVCLRCLETGSVSFNKTAAIDLWNASVDDEYYDCCDEIDDDLAIALNSYKTIEENEINEQIDDNLGDVSISVVCINNDKNEEKGDSNNEKY